MEEGEDGELPIHNVLSKQRYSNENKFKNLYGSGTSPAPPLIKITKQKEKAFDDLYDDGSRSFSKKTKYELQ